MDDRAIESKHETTRLRSKMVEHLEAALALALETKDGATRYCIESALETIRAKMRPALSEVPRRSERDDRA